MIIAIEIYKHLKREVDLKVSKFLLFRVDSRLVHGQVCTAWIPEMEIKRVIIVHEEYSKDKLLIDLHQAVVPQNVKCDTIDAQQALNEWEKDEFGDQNTLVIFQTVDEALKLFKLGVPMKELQVATLSGTKKSVSIYKQVNVTTEDALNFKELIGSNVDVYCQMFPSNPRVSVKELLEQKKYKSKLGI